MAISAKALTQDNVPQFTAEKYCTDLDDLNQTTVFYHQNSFDITLSKKLYPARLYHLGIFSIDEIDQLQLLTNEMDSVVCGRIREKLFPNRTSTFVWDIERARYYPSDYLLIYRGPSNNFIAFTRTYNPGDAPNEIGPPIMGGGFTVLFDANLNRVTEPEN